MQHLSAVEKQYRDLIKEALRYFHDPRWLGEHSPLSTPYLLGHYLLRNQLPHVSTHQQPDALLRGNILHELIRTAINIIAQEDENRPLPWARILELRYLTDRPMKIREIHDELSTSESAEGREHVKALDALVVELFTLFKPSLRLEMPTPVQSLVGRQAELDLCLTELAAGKTIALHGPSGIGKTTFGSVLAYHFAPDAFFWFTFRLGFNDHENSVIFAIAYFLHQQGIIGTWLQLMADQGHIQEYTYSLLRHDLQELTTRRVLLCFDEVDLLRPAEVQAHTRLLPFLESLRQAAPLLFIGQKPTVDADHVIVLPGLNFSATQQMLSKPNIALNYEELLKLHQQTQGNPRLIELYIARFQAMRRQGLTLAMVFNESSSEPSMELLLQRIWHHLNVEEMHLLEIMAIFQNPMPHTAWAAQNEQEALALLLEWRLLRTDGQGSVAMLPILQETISRGLDADEAASLHLEAAKICLYYRQFTAAGYHYQSGGMAELSVYLLQEHLNTELDQGQAFAAAQVLKTIAAHQLRSEKEREILRLLKARLHQTLGEHEAALDDIQKSLWQIPFLKVQAHRLEGDILELQGEPIQALQAYSAATETITTWISESANLHRAMGYLHVHGREFIQAQQQVWLIRHDGANLEGYILSKRRDFEGAQSAYLEAIEFAQLAQYPYGEANAGMNLGTICGWRGEIDEAEKHLHEAIDFFEMTGRINKLAEATYNLAFVRRLANRFHAAIEPAEEALQLFTRINRHLGCVYAMQILAEVYTALDDLAQAEHFALAILQEENVNIYPDSLRVLGEIRLKQGNLSEAERLLRESQEIAQQSDDPVLLGYILRSLSEVLVAKNDHQSAVAALTKALQFFHKAEMKAEAKTTQQLLDRQQIR